MMKVCPKCRTQYTDVSLRFCLQDGAELISPSEEKTEQFNADEFSAAETVAVEVSPPTSSVENEKTNDEFPSQETVVSRANEGQEKKGVSGFLLGLLAGLLVLGGLAVIGLGVAYLPGLLGKDDPKPQFIEKTERLGRSDISKVRSSSTRKKDGKITYSPENALDNDETTAWCEGVTGPGKGEWVRVEFEKTEKLVELRIKPGYFKNTTVWKKNNRVASISVLFSDGTERVFEFPDSPRERKIKLPSIESDSVKITIRDVHSGTADRLDTLITDIGFSAVRMVEQPK